MAQSPREVWTKHLTYEIEVNSAITTNKGLRAWWRMYVPEQNMWIYNLRETDCKDRKFIDYKLLTRNKNGELIKEYPVAQNDVTYVAPGTIDQAILNYHCGYGPDFKSSESFKDYLKKLGQ